MRLEYSSPSVNLLNRRSGNREKESPILLIKVGETCVPVIAPAGNGGGIPSGDSFETFQRDDLLLFTSDHLVTDDYIE